MYLVRHPVESLEHVYGKNVLYVCVLPDSLHSHVTRWLVARRLRRAWVGSMGWDHG